MPKAIQQEQQQHLMLRKRLFRFLRQGMQMTRLAKLQAATRQLQPRRTVVLRFLPLLPLRV